jgi:curved DNA-binding protein
MPASDSIDHYEALQVSHSADLETIQRVYRHLAKRYHPDNAESGDGERFRQVSAAFQVLSDPERRAQYDIGYERHQKVKWRIFNQETATDDMATDRRVREAILSVLYTARRNDADQSGMGVYDLEQLLGCPEEHMKFHVWYLKENGLIQRLENGMLAITARGVDWVLEHGGPRSSSVPLLKPVDQWASATSGNGAQ